MNGKTAKSLNIVLITAGGMGERFGAKTPKQFHLIDGKPLIIYTLEKFQHHESIDAIVVSCIAGWEQKLREYAQTFGISKLEHIATGGDSNQESICNGVAEIDKHYDDESRVLIHDAARPLVTEAIITDCLNVMKKYGNAVACIPCLEPLLRVNEKGDPKSSYDFYPREGVMRAQAPQGFSLKQLKWAHAEAAKQHITHTTASSVLMQKLGVKLYCSRSSTNNIKVTTLDDIAFLRAWL